MSTPWIIAVVALWVFVLLLAVVVIGLLRRVAGVLEQAEAAMRANEDSAVALGGLAVGEEVPSFRVWETPAGETTSREVSSAELLHKPSILLFMGSECAPCRNLAPELATAEDVLNGTPLFVVVDEHDNTSDWLPPNVLVLRDVRREMAQAFGNAATPQGYLVDERSTIRAKRIVQSLTDIKSLAKPTQLIET